MRITFTIEDRENGHVKIDSNPDIEKLIAAGKDKKTRTPAEGYALVALAAMVEFSGKVAQEISGLEGIAKTRLGLH